MNIKDDFAGRGFLLAAFVVFVIECPWQHDILLTNCLLTFAFSARTVTWFGNSTTTSVHSETAECQWFAACQWCIVQPSVLSFLAKRQVLPSNMAGLGLRNVPYCGMKAAVWPDVGACESSLSTTNKNKCCIKLHPRLAVMAMWRWSLHRDVCQSFYFIKYGGALFFIKYFTSANIRLHVHTRWFAMDNAMHNRTMRASEEPTVAFIYKM